VTNSAPAPLDAAVVARVRSRGEAHAEQGSERVHVATMLATMVRRRAG
jgi:hypothetical protein